MNNSGIILPCFRILGQTTTAYNYDARGVPQSYLQMLKRSSSELSIDAYEVHYKVSCGCLRDILQSYLQIFKGCLRMLKSKYLFWEEILRKRSSLAEGLELSRYRINMELQVLCYVTQCPWYSGGCHGYVFQTR